MCSEYFGGRGISSLQIFFWRKAKRVRASGAGISASFQGSMGVAWSQRGVQRIQDSDHVIGSHEGEQPQTFFIFWEKGQNRKWGGDQGSRGSWLPPVAAGCPIPFRLYHFVLRAARSVRARVTQPVRASCVAPRKGLQHREFQRRPCTVTNRRRTAISLVKVEHHAREMWKKGYKPVPVLHCQDDDKSVGIEAALRHGAAGMALQGRCYSDGATGMVLQGWHYRDGGCQGSAVGTVLQGTHCRDGAAGMAVRMVLQGWHCRDGPAGMTLQGRR